MSYPYETAPTNEVGIALWVMERHEWVWRKLEGNTSGFITRSRLAAKTTSLVAHDRILTGEWIERGLPSFYGDKEASHD